MTYPTATTPVALTADEVRNLYHKGAHALWLAMPDVVASYTATTAALDEARGALEKQREAKDAQIMALRDDATRDHETIRSLSASLRKAEQRGDSWAMRARAAEADLERAAPTT